MMSTVSVSDLKNRAAWPDRRILDLFDIDLPIIQAPMAGASTSAMAVEVSKAGGLGSLPCAMMTPEQAGRELDIIRQATDRPINLNFFSHTPPKLDDAAIEAWRDSLSSYYTEYAIDQTAPLPISNRAPFDEAFCKMVEAYKPAVVSFHFGLPSASFVARVKAVGAKVISTATTVAEAKWLDDRGVDAIIAMGSEAGGHQGNFLNERIAGQIGTFALVPQIVDAVAVPVIAAGGIADGRGVAAAFNLGAAAVQIGTAYLFSPEATVKDYHRKALRESQAEDTALTNVFTGRPARGIINRLMREVGPISDIAPAFPLAGGALMPLRAKTEAAGNPDFSNMWSGQAARLAKEMPAAELTRYLAQKALQRLHRR
jgi:nitronate monooxygenase